MAAAAGPCTMTGAFRNGMAEFLSGKPPFFPLVSPAGINSYPQDNLSAI
jgi:hypothetical protein